MVCSKKTGVWLNSGYFFGRATDSVRGGCCFCSSPLWSPDSDGFHVARYSWNSASLLNRRTGEFNIQHRCFEREGKQIV